MSGNIDPLAERERAIKELPAAFIHSNIDQYAILQLPHESRNLFLPLELVERLGVKIDPSNYNFLYLEKLPSITNTAAFLEEVFTRFNIDRPKDFYGHSFSVSDIIAIRQNGVVDCYYCDEIGFKQLENFALVENYLKNAEMAVEDDYGMVDGIINNGKADRSNESTSILKELQEKAEITKQQPPKPKKQKCEER